MPGKRVLLASLMIGAACGCAGTSFAVRARIDRAQRELPDDPAVRAGLARVRAAEALRNSHSAVPSLQLRAQNISATNLDRGRGVEFRARVALESPWSTILATDADQARVEAATGELEHQTNERRSIYCLRAVRASAAHEQIALAGALAQRIEPVLEWNRAFEGAGALDALETSRMQVSATRRLLDAQIAELPGPHRALPELVPAPGALVRDRERVREWIRDHHPRPAALLAQSRRYAHLADREQLRILPWFDWVQAGYQTGSLGAQDLEVGVALRVPLDDRAGADATALAQQGDAARFDAQTAIDDLAYDAAVALAELALFEQRIAALQSILEQSARAEATADQWASAHRGTPRTVADLYFEAFSARLAVLRARVDAASARCDLLAASATALEQWPRESAR